MFQVFFPVPYRKKTRKIEKRRLNYTSFTPHGAPFFNFEGLFGGTLPENKPEKLKKGASITRHLRRTGAQIMREPAREGRLDSR